jgi:hypothetical protein
VIPAPTQVLESLATRGQPSRAEVTDAAMGARAECAMLNKGPYVLDAVRFLDDVLRRMQDHHHKKSSMLRRLSVCGLAGTALREGSRSGEDVPTICASQVPSDPQPDSARETALPVVVRTSPHFRALDPSQPENAS